MKLVAVSSPPVPIYGAINDEEVALRLCADRTEGAIGAAHWFRDANLWYRLSPGYNNPLNIGSVHSELFLIRRASSDVSRLLDGRMLVFFGVGVGDTEMAFVDLQLQAARYSEQVLIDVNPVFLDAFTSSLCARRMENDTWDLRCGPVRALFETLDGSVVDVPESRFRQRALICLGSTIGNYADTADILSAFRRVSTLGDVLILGYQLNTHIELVFRRYESNPLFRELIGNFLTREEQMRIRWELGRQDTVEAWLDDVQLFRSRKFRTDDVAAVAGAFGWTERFRQIDGSRNLALHAFEHM